MLFKPHKKVNSQLNKMNYLRIYSKVQNNKTLRNLIIYSDSTLMFNSHLLKIKKLIKMKQISNKIMIIHKKLQVYLIFLKKTIQIIIQKMKIYKIIKLKKVYLVSIVK
jgi:hypothetical protein